MKNVIRFVPFNPGNLLLHQKNRTVKSAVVHHNHHHHLLKIVTPHVKHVLVILLAWLLHTSQVASQYQNQNYAMDHANDHKTNQLKNIVHEFPKNSSTIAVKLSLN